MTITALPTPPSRDDPANFTARADAFLGALPTFATEANALAADVNSDAADAAASAAAAAASAGATKWVSGTTYAEGDVVWSPTTYFIYRRKTAGAGTTDPASDTTNWASVAGTGDVTLTGTQTLTNKTISADSNTFSGIAASSFVVSNASGNIDGAAAQKTIPAGVVVGDTDAQTLTNKTLSGAILNDGYTEEVFAVSGTTPALSPTNGSIQTWTLSGNSTPTAGTWAAGQSITLMIDDGSAYTVTWTSLSVTWKTGGGTAPTLNTSGFTAIALWKVGTTIYGARVGDA